MTPSTSLAGTAALVFGASRGIGAAITRGLAAAGTSIVAASRDRAGLDALVVEICDAGGTAIAVPTDVTDERQVAAAVQRVIDEFGGLDIGCNNAAASHQPTPLADVGAGDFDNVVAVNLRGTFLAMKYQISAMVERSGGVIVNMSSTTGFHPVAGLAPYVATKHAIEGLTRVAALDYAHAGIRVNTVAPGPILTDRLRAAGEQAQQTVAASIPLGHLGEPARIADTVVWLCSDAAAFITGTTIVADGGLTAGSPPFQPPSHGA